MTWPIIWICTFCMHIVNKACSVGKVLCIAYNYIHIPAENILRYCTHMQCCCTHMVTGIQLLLLSYHLLKARNFSPCDIPNLQYSSLYAMHMYIYILCKYLNPLSGLRGVWLYILHNQSMLDCCAFSTEFGQKSIVKRAFQSPWFKRWNWLHYGKSQDVVFCFHV